MRFLHGQVTNEIKGLLPRAGCYAALVTAKGRMQSDLNIYNLGDELLLDFEPGLTAMVSQRLEKYIIADDVQVVDVAAIYGLLSIQGPNAGEVIRVLSLFKEIPANAFGSSKTSDLKLGELYLTNHSRTGTTGFDLFVPNSSLLTVAQQLDGAAKSVKGRYCGWSALEMVRIEAGIPRFGLDMDETNFPQESGIGSQAVSYSKGCYIGQEILNRLHTMGHVNRQLCGLRLPDRVPTLPVKGDKLFYEGKEVGYITSALASPALNANIALGYVRTQTSHAGCELSVGSRVGDIIAHVVELPFPNA